MNRFFPALLLLLCAGHACADNWPHWRGPNHDGISKETNLPTTWSDTKNVVWKMAMPGMAGSTPAIWGERIFLTSQDGDDTVLLCISTQGKQLWKRKLGEAVRSRKGGEANAASPSPST